MPRWLQVTLHALSIAAGAYAAYKTGSPLPLVISSGVQGAVGIVAQAYNTDGTPQMAAFVPKEAPKPPA